MAPNLNLVYNSQGGPGMAGLGWDMTGLSAVQRCRKTKVADGYTQGIEMRGASIDSNAGDGVCLDGKRLFFKESSYSSATFEMDTQTSVPWR
jgi:hypothetical protein